jgi:hypothetical protein
MMVTQQRQGCPLLIMNFARYLSSKDNIIIIFIIMVVIRLRRGKSLRARPFHLPSRMHTRLGS